ncbi:MAG: hypothetical protein ACE5JR_11645 [Gemmatimonadota bacterium]
MLIHAREYLDFAPRVLLTRGIVWNLYHLSFEKGIECATAF